MDFSNRRNLPSIAGRSGSERRSKTGDLDLEVSTRRTSPRETPTAGDRLALGGRGPIAGDRRTREGLLGEDRRPPEGDRRPATEARPRREEPRMRGGGVGERDGEWEGDRLEERAREADRLLRRTGSRAISKKE